MATTTNYRTLEFIAEEAGLLQERTAENVIFTDYSGRGMYGRLCVGLRLDETGQLVDVGRALAAVLDVDELDEWGTPSTDSLGRGIIAYWTRVQCSDALGEEEE